MKKLLLMAFLAWSSIAYAATDTRSIRTSTDIVTYGDTTNSMLSKLGRPEDKNEYTTRDRNGKLVFATDYSYSIDGLKYTITVLEGQVFRIVWER